MSQAGFRLMTPHWSRPYLYGRGPNSAANSWKLSIQSHVGRKSVFRFGSLLLVRTRDGYAQVASQSSRKSVKSQLGRGSFTSITMTVPWSGVLLLEFHVDRHTTDLACQSQVTLITWLILQFLYSYFGRPALGVNLRPNDKSSMTTHESKKYRVLQLISRHFGVNIALDDQPTMWCNTHRWLPYCAHFWLYKTWWGVSGLPYRIPGLPYPFWSIRYICMLSVTVVKPLFNNETSTYTPKSWIFTLHDNEKNLHYL